MFRLVSRYVLLQEQAIRYSRFFKFWAIWDKGSLLIFVMPEHTPLCSILFSKDIQKIVPHTKMENKSFGYKNKLFLTRNS